MYLLFIYLSIIYIIYHLYLLFQNTLNGIDINILYYIYYLYLLSINQTFLFYLSC